MTDLGDGKAIKIINQHVVKPVSRTYIAAMRRWLKIKPNAYGVSAKRYFDDEWKFKVDVWLEDFKELEKIREELIKYYYLLEDHPKLKEKAILHCYKRCGYKDKRSMKGSFGNIPYAATKRVSYPILLNRRRLLECFKEAVKLHRGNINVEEYLS